MPRQARIDAPGSLHHIICRGIEGREIFRDDDDREDFVGRLGAIVTATSTRCLAWALLPNHFHLLLQTGAAPIATFMRRLLTGYAIAFNRRHQRHGHLFQNRYKSILCQEESYLLELVRYIHLNPLRAGVVSSLEELDAYRYGGHRQMLGGHTHPWMTTTETLSRFGACQASALLEYRRFIADGAGQGKRPEFIRGALVRSACGWHETQGTDGRPMKGDERILGDRDFVDHVLHRAGEILASRSAYRHRGINLERISDIVARVLEIPVAEVWKPGRQPLRVQARSLLCFWAVRELGESATALAERLGLSQPAVSVAVQRGEKLVAVRGWQLAELLS
jgi:REP element-mobilizing transposase RayT